MLNVLPMALLTGYAYERAGVAASIAVHFAVNATVALLGVSSPVTQALIVAVQVIVAIPLLARSVSHVSLGRVTPAADLR
jgi:membrane protease YdiL (CAAX protease family)